MPPSIELTTLQQAFREQYHAGLAMLVDCIEKCPEDVWTAGAHPRPFWRIAFHAVFFTHLYLAQTLENFQPWPGRPDDASGLWGPVEIQPYDLPEDAVVYTRRTILDYIDYVDSIIDPTVDSLDLSSPVSGIPWYKTMGKLSHEMLNVRHLQGHVGQLSELLMERGIDTKWVSKA